MDYQSSRYNVLTTMTNGVTVLYNLFSNGLAEVEEDNIEHVKYLLSHCNEPVEGQLREIREYLIHNGYLIPADVSEIDIIRQRNMSRRFDQRQYSLTIMPTLDCNFACTYCYETRQKGFLSRKAIEGVKKLIHTKAMETQNLHLSWFGGEPMLDFSILEEVNQWAVATCAEHGCRFSSHITTNGSLFTDEILQKIDALHLSKIQITLDGTAEYHDRLRPLRNGGGTFDVVFANILKILDQTKAIVQLRVNVNKENYQDIPALMEMFPVQYRTSRLKIYFRNIFLTPQQGQQNREAVDTINSSHFMLRDLYLYALRNGFHTSLPVAFLKDFYCETCIKNNYVLHPSGDIFKCTVGFEQEKRVGGISSTGELEIDYGISSRWLSHVPGDDQQCRECILLPLCQGGCRYMRFVGKRPCPYEVDDLDGIVEMIYFYTQNGCSE